MLQLNTHIRTLEAEFSALLNTRVFGREARFLESTDSTNTQAMAWACDAAPEGSLVLAESQTAGRGRHGRTWEARASNNLLFSIVLRPNLAPPQLGLITLVASLALADTIDQFIAPYTTAIKWPNDILIHGKKCSGMLMESAISIGNEGARLPVVLGIGININQEIFPEPIAEKSTSLLLESGRHIPRMAFLTQFLSKLEVGYFSINSEQNEALLSQYQLKMAYMGEDTALRFVGKDETVKGKIKGVSQTGALVLQMHDGLHEFHAGEVTGQGA